MVGKKDLSQGLDAGACGAGTPVVERPAKVVTKWGKAYETQNYRADVLQAWLARGGFADHERILVWKDVGMLWWWRRVVHAVRPTDIKKVK